MSENDQGWEAYWRTYGQQLEDWANQAESVAEGLHMPAQIQAPIITKVVESSVNAPERTWRDRKPML